MSRGNRAVGGWSLFARGGRGTALATAIFALCVGVLFSASLFGGKVLSPNDIAFFNPPFSVERPAALNRASNPDLVDALNILTPQMLVARATVRAGQLPLWDPAIGAGRPIIANQQAALFFPLTWLAFFTSFWHSLAWIAALRLLLAALGMFVLCRALGLGMPASVLGGLAFGFGTGPLVWAEHPVTNVVAAIPWMFAFAERLWQRASTFDALGLAAALGLGLLGGHPESFFVAAVGLGAFVLFRAAIHYRGNERTGLAARTALSLAAGVVGALIGAVAVLPLLELLAHAYRPSRNLLGADPLGKVLSGVLFPEMFGRPDKQTYVPIIKTVPDLFAGRAVYIGAIPLLLALGGLAVRRSATQLFFAILGAISALAVVGAPVLGYLIRHLPGFSTVYAHWFLWLSILSAAVLSAYGLEILLKAGRAQLARMAAVMAAAAVGATAWGLTQVHGLPLASAFGQLPVISSHPPSAQVVALASVVRFALLALILVGLIVGLIVTRPRRRSAVTWAVGIAAIAVTALDLLSLDHGYHPQVSLARADPPLPASLRTLQATSHTQRVIAEGNALHPNLAERYGLYDPRSEYLPMPQRSTALFAALGGVVDPSVGATLYDPLQHRGGDLLNLFSVRYVLALGARGLGADAQLKPVYGQPGQTVLLNPTALPRAWIAYSWRPATGFHDALRQTVAVDAAALEQAPVVEGSPPPPSGTQPRGASGTITSDTDNEVSVLLDARKPGYLILNDTYYPGWQAQLDGHGVQIHPANTAFRAVAVPAGRHRIVFRYWPASAYVGLVLTLVGLLAAAGLAALGLVAVRRSRRRLAPAEDSGP